MLDRLKQIFSDYVKGLYVRIEKPGAVGLLCLKGTLVTIALVSVGEFILSRVMDTNLAHDLFRGAILATLVAWPSYMLSGTIIKQNVRLSRRFSEAYQLANRTSRELIQKNEELELARERLAELANSDHLTGLANRRNFEQLLTQSYSGEIHQRPTGVLVLLDLNGFKSINDEHGHDAGDAVLRHVAVRIRKCIGDLDGIGARLGGDEFSIMIWEDMDTAQATNFANDLRDSLRQPHAYKGNVLHASASISFTPHPGHFSSATDLYVTTDKALMMCKRTDKDNIVIVHSVGEYSLAS